MRFGVCADLKYATVLAEAGYDYIELSVAADLMPEDPESVWKEHCKKIQQMPLPVEAFNSFVRTGKITGPHADFPRLQRYVDTALKRAGEVGGRVVVFGSGGARQVPEGFSAAEANVQILRFLEICARAGEQTGVTVVIEPLCKAECNIINLVSEGASLARTVQSKWVQNLADTYHLEKEAEPLTAIVESADVLAHVHTADTGRLAPSTGTYPHVSLFDILAQAGYEKRMSIECSWQNQLEMLAAPALQHLRSCRQEAKTTR